MIERNYRAGRAKVTEKIYNALFKLINTEKDYGKKKKHTAQWYIDRVVEILQISDAENPSLRSYEEKIKEIRNGLRKKNPLDAPWTIGACEKYGIPGDMIPHLIELQKLYREPLQLLPLTIR